MIFDGIWIWTNQCLFSGLGIVDIYQSSINTRSVIFGSGDPSICEGKKEEICYSQWESCKCEQMWWSSCRKCVLRSELIIKIPRVHNLGFFASNCCMLLHNSQLQCICQHSRTCSNKHSKFHWSDGHILFLLNELLFHFI